MTLQILRERNSVHQIKYICSTESVKTHAIGSAYKITIQETLKMAGKV
jgi:hypothetical protein